MNHLTLDDIRQLITFSANNPVDGIYEVEGGPYYRFFYWLTRATQPNLVVELGSLHGHSAANLAQGAPADSRVISIDWNPPANPPRFPNLEFWKGDTLEMAQKIADLNIPIDILFLDSSHFATHAEEEFDLYWPLMSKGGILLVDDIYLADMRDFWNSVPEPKMLDDTLHRGDLGFGIAVKEG